MADDLFGRIGFTNLTAEAGIIGFGVLPLETLVASSPDLIVFESMGDGPPSVAAELLHHPVLSHGGIGRVAVPMRLWACPDPALVDAARPHRRGGPMKTWLPELILGLILLGLVAASASIGSTRLTALSMFADAPGIRTLARTVVLDIRLPRTVLAVLAGASLGLSGAVLQGLLRNPLADPGVIGISAVASLGAVLAFYFGLWSVAAGGIAGGLAAALLLITLAGRNTGTPDIATGRRGAVELRRRPDLPGSQSRPQSTGRP